jgi:uncharacterized protein
MIDKLKYKYERLKKIIRNMGYLLVAYSGGVDSSFLLKVAKDELAKNVLAVIAKSPTYPESEFVSAKNFVKKYKIDFQVIETEELNNPKFSKNPKNRCYYCKDELFSKLRHIAREKNLKYVVDGTNYEDRLDYRPGNRAKKKHNIRSPLFEAKLTKSEIRELSREMGLSCWNKPSLACLSSRFPYNSTITEKDLRRINIAEDFLRRAGFSQVRVRHYNSLARIEIAKDEIKKFLKIDYAKIINKFKKLGYNYITLDLEGYRSGSMNEVLDLNIKSKAS